jgi:L-malate glycosyltransferase
VNVLYLTNNPQLAGTSRILLSWLTLGRANGVRGCVAVQQAGSLVEWLRSNDVPSLVSSMPWPNRKWPVPLLYEGLRVAMWARSHKVVLIHCNEHDIYPFGSFLRTLLRVPLVCHVRFNLSRGFCEWAFGGRRQPDALLWTSKQQREDCAEAIAGIVAETRQHLIPLGPDLSKFGTTPVDRNALRAKLGLQPDDIAIGTATALRPIKRIEDFVDLIAQLSGRHPNVVGLIAGGAVAGDESYREMIEQRIDAARLGRRLRWLGHLEPIEPFLRALDIFVSTSQYETFGNSVVEAMACQLPVAAYAGGSVQEVIGDAGYVVPTGDIAGLLADVERLVAAAPERVRYGRLGLERVATHFNPAVSFGRLRVIYDDLIATR